MEKALKLRNILLRSFVIALVLLVVSHLFFFFGSDFIISVFEKIYGITAPEARLSIVFACNAMKVMSVMFFLIPALAIHLEYTKCDCILSKNKEK